jgi:hypothetical protein
MTEGNLPNVSLHIERLVLAGLPLAGGQAAQVQRAMERELGRLLRLDGLGRAPGGGAVPEVAAPAIQLSSPFRPADLGRQIARSVHESLTRGL